MDRKRKKVVLLIPDLKAGGTQKVATSILDLGLEKIDVSVLVLTGGSSNENIDRVKFLDAGRVLESLWQLRLYLNTNRPDIVIAFMDIALLALFLIRPFVSLKKIIYRPSSIPSAMNTFYSKGKLRRLSEILAIRLLKSRVWCQSAEQKIEYSFCLSHEVFVLGNFSTVYIESSTNQADRSLFLITRNSPEKGVKRALEILSKDKTKWTQLSLYGIDKNVELYDFCKELYIANKVHFKGYVSKEKIFQTENGVFMQSSYVEAFPNALLEAICAGFRTISLPSVGATEELSSYCKHTMVVSDHDFFIGLDLIIDQDIDASGLQRFKDSYSKEAFKSSFQNLLLD